MKLIIKTIAILILIICIIVVSPLILAFGIVVLIAVLLDWAFSDKTLKQSLYNFFGK